MDIDWDEVAAKVLNAVVESTAGGVTREEHDVIVDQLREFDKREAQVYCLTLASAVGGMKPALSEAARLQLKKDLDYNQGPVKLESYFPFGLKSYVQELHKKTLRLVSIAADERPPENESVRDSCLDLINYASFLVAAIDRGDI